MLPSRTDFFKTGLVPASTQFSSEDSCIICTDDLTEPVTLTSCSHNFCKTCITKWLTQKSRNTCPTCRAVLFALDDSDKGPVQGDRMVVMAQAMTHAGLLGGGYMRFSDNIHINISDLYRAAAQANLWLGEEFHRSAAGPAVVERGRLGSHVIAMGNLIRGYAQAMGRPYNLAQMREWRLLVRALYDVIEKWDGRMMDAMVIPRLLKEETKKHLVQGRFLDDAFFEEEVRPGSLQADWEILLAYIATKAADGFAARESISRETRREPIIWGKLSLWLRNLV